MKIVQSQKGFTIIELVIVMSIFLIIMTVCSNTFVRIVGQSSQLRKTSETNIEGIIGLEILRRDLESAGYGLPWSFMNPGGIQYREVDVVTDWLVQGINSNTFNDAPTDVPRALASAPSAAGNKIIDGTAGAHLTNPGSNYLVIKSVNVAFNDVSKKWSYVNYSTSEGSDKSYIHQWNSTAENFSNNDSIITLVTSAAGAGVVRQLAMKGTTDYSYKFTGDILSVDSNYKPKSATTRSTDNVRVTDDMYVVYGINNIRGTNTIRMPFNRADYYVRRTDDTPNYCNRGTGVFYKAVVTNTLDPSNVDVGGGYTWYPLLDCVGYLQVQYELDRSGTDNLGAVDFTDTLAGMDAQAIREQLRTVRVYILAHEGKKDKNYSYPHPNDNRVIVVGDPGLTSIGKVFRKADMESYFGADWFNYRWKVYVIAVRPKNLNN